MTSVLKSDMNYRFLLLFEKERGCLLPSTFSRREGSFLATALETRQLRETSLEKRRGRYAPPKARRRVINLTCLHQQREHCQERGRRDAATTRDSHFRGGVAASRTLGVSGFSPP